MKNVLLLTALSVTLFAAPAFADSHRCVDKIGKEISLFGSTGSKQKACKAKGGRWAKVKKYRATPKQ